MRPSPILITDVFLEIPPPWFGDLFVSLSTLINHTLEGFVDVFKNWHPLFVGVVCEFQCLVTNSNLAIIGVKDHGKTVLILQSHMKGICRLFWIVFWPLGQKKLSDIVVFVHDGVLVSLLIRKQRTGQV